MTNILILGVENLTTADYTTVSTTGFLGLSPDDMGPEWLKTEEPSDVARLTILDPKHTQFVFDYAELDSIVRGFGMGNHNLAAGGRVRLLGSLDPGTPWTYQTQAPNAIVTSNNITGGVTNVDEAIDAPDGLVIAPTVATNQWSVTFSWAALGFAPNIAAGMASIVLRARLNATGAGAADPVTYPKFTVDLWEGGVLKKTLGYRAVTQSAAGGQIFIFPFSFSDLTATSGADLEISITSTVGASLSGSQYSSLEAIALYYEKDPFTLGGPTHDSGWREVYGKSRSDPSASFHEFWDEDWIGIHSTVLLIQSDQSAHDPQERTMDFSIPYRSIATPDSFVQLGVAPIGPAIIPEVGVQHGSGPAGRPVSAPLGPTTAGGQSYGSDGFRRREMRGLDLIVTRDELALLQSRVGYQKGSTGAIYVALEPKIDFRYQLFTAFWGTADFGEPMVFGRYKTGGAMKFLLPASFVEKL